GLCSVEVGLGAPGPECLQHCPPARPASAGAEQSRELHRDRGCTGAHPPSVHVFCDRAPHGAKIDAVMIVEAVILAGDERLEEIRIDLAERDTALQRAM